MHEFSIVDQLLYAATRHASQAHASSVTRLRLSIGELSGVDAGLLDKAFSTFRERTICAQAELVIDTVPASWECPACGIALGRGERLACRRCGTPARLAAGGELVLERIEMEVPDV